MANPTKPKDAKPKADGDDFEIKQTIGGASGAASGSLVTTIAVAAVAALIVIAANYFLMDVKMSQMSQKLAALSAAAAPEEEVVDEGEGVGAERGIILDLGEFILNLSDPDVRKFLKVNVAIELSKKESDILAAEAAAKASGGGHGHGGGAPVDPMKEIENEMNQFKPSIRDAIISILSSKTSHELATTPGKELAKEQIKESINALFEGEREVLRVSFGSFFIQ